LGNTTAGGNEYGSGFGTHYFTASSNNTLWLRQSTAGTTDITSFSIKEYTSADMNVTRATAATRVDENGLVNYAEVIGSELVTNGDFATDSDWNNFGTPTTSEQSTEQSHTGTYSWKIIADATLEGIYSPNNFSVTSGLQYTVSLWIYSVSGTSIKSGLNNTNASVFTVRTVTAGQWTNITYEATAHTTGASYISILSENSLNFYVDNVSVKEVTRDNVPRIDYTGGGCPHILAEPMRTNLVTYSEDFSEWSKLGSTEVTPDTTISPDGTLNADSFTFTTSTSDKIQQTVTVVASQQYTVSCYIKSDSNITIKMGGAAASTPINVTTEWVRHTVTQTNGAGTTAYPQLTSNGTAGTVYVYGFQLEEASYPTSYIPTSGSTVTRNKDIFTRDGIGSLINSTEGVLFVEMAALSDDNTDRRLSLNDGSANNEIRIGYSRFTGNIISEVASGGIQQNINWGATGVTQTNNNKFALSWGNGTLKFYVNGSQTNIETGITSPVGLNTLKFSKGNDIEEMFAKVKQLQVYKTALTDEQLLQLTGTSGTDFYESYAEMASALTYTIQ